MNSAVLLALMTKAKKVFGADNTFLSFPVSPLPYTKRGLDFFSAHDAEELRQSQRNLQAFSTLVNLIPDDEAWLPKESLFLWEVYDRILKEGDFAVSSRTPKEEEAYQRALTFLRVVNEGGMVEDSAPVKAYRQHKDAFLLAEQKYNADKFTGENAADPAERQRWRDVEEPAQRANLDDLRTKWITAGHKNEVEEAQAKVVSLGARSPLQTSNEWKSRFNEDIDTLTGGPDTSTVYPSFFSPSNALDDNAWQPFKLSEEEVKILINEAPEELRARFAANSAAAAGKSLTFEFSSASIQRPWFVSDVFRSRFWRFADASRVISDGGKPAKGQCPAYVTAIVFARKVKEEEKPVEPVRPVRPVRRPGGVVVTTSKSVRPRKSARPVKQARPTIKKFGGFQFGAMVRDHTRLKGTPAKPSPGAKTLGGAKAAASSRAASIRMRNSAMMRVGVMKDAQTGAALDQKASLLQLRNFQAMSFTRSGVVLSQPSQPVNPAISMPKPTVQDDSIYILAFICKSLPKCPDPDPALQW